MGTMEALPAIELVGLSKIYRSRRRDDIQAVAGLDLAIGHGEVLGFLGPNGAGKTTSIKMICGLILPDTGTIRIQGHNLQRHRFAAMRSIGAVLEGTRNIYWRLSPLQNLAYAARLKGVSSRHMQTWAETLLRDLELWDRRHDPVRLFSRGMQQKTAIACALIHNPPIVLLDEPTLGLDVQAAATVKQWIQTLATRFRKTLVLTTHHLHLAEELCQRVVIMHQGHKIADQDVKTLQALHRREFLHVKVAAPETTVRPLALRAWPNATLQTEPQATTISIPAGGRDQFAEVAATVTTWSLDVLAIEQAVPSLEDIFIHLTNNTHSHV